jgi:exosortase/archaeosortase family protein
MIPNKQNNPIKFAAWFIGLFLVFYYFNILFFGVTSPGKFYSPFLAEHLNYIQWLRWVLLQCSAFVINSLGFSTVTNNYELLVAGRGVIQLVYSCLGLGLISFFAAFVLAYPKPRKAKIIFLLSGILVIELLNTFRFVFLALFWTRQQSAIIDHHTIFNILMYVIIAASLYFWVKADIAENNAHAKN